MTWPDNERKVLIRYRHKFGLTALVIAKGGIRIDRFRVSHASRHQARFVLPTSAMGTPGVETKWRVDAVSRSRGGSCEAAVAIDLLPEHGYISPKSTVRVGRLDGAYLIHRG